MILCEVCKSPHVSMPRRLDAESEVFCRRCGRLLATVLEWQKALQHCAAANDQSRAEAADAAPVRQRSRARARFANAVPFRAAQVSSFFSSEDVN